MEEKATINPSAEDKTRGLLPVGGQKTEKSILLSVSSFFFLI